MFTFNTLGDVDVTLTVTDSEGNIDSVTKTISVVSGVPTINEMLKLHASDSTSYDSFGVSIAIDGDRALVGAQNDDDLGSASGSVYVYEFDGTNWNEVTKLNAEFGASNDLFGVSVSLDGDRAVVGAMWDDDHSASNSGSAYVFEYDGSAWSQVAKLTASDFTANDHFGTSVAISGGRIAVGADRDDDNGTASSGSVYLFDFDGVQTWNEVGKLTCQRPGSQRLLWWKHRNGR